MWAWFQDPCSLKWEAVPIHDRGILHCQATWSQCNWTFSTKCSLPTLCWSMRGDVFSFFPFGLTWDGSWWFWYWSNGRLTVLAGAIKSGTPIPSYFSSSRRTLSVYHPSHITLVVWVRSADLLPLFSWNAVWGSTRCIKIAVLKHDSKYFNTPTSNTPWRCMSHGDFMTFLVYSLTSSSTRTLSSPLKVRSSVPQSTYRRTDHCYVSQAVVSMFLCARYEGCR